MLTYFLSSKFIKYKEHLMYHIFRYSKVRKNSVLVIEPNAESHGEVLPYFVKYFLSRKYNVDVICSSFLNYLQCLDAVKDRRLHKYTFSPMRCKKFIKSEKLKEYKYIFFNSCIIYYEEKKYSIFDMFEGADKLRDKIYYVQHHLDLGVDSHAIALAKTKNLPEYVTVVNSHYFGKIKPHKKNKYTNFIFVGALEKQRRDCSLLIDAVNKLTEEGITNFHITHIGRETLDVPENIKSYFSPKGYLRWKETFKQVQNSDFYLMLLNPEISEHKRYIDDGTSGSFQIVYGFVKPCIIQKTFSDAYDMNDCSIVYNSNENLYNAMKEAINMSQKDYDSLCENLKNHISKIEKISDDNMDKIFKGRQL